MLDLIFLPFRVVWDVICAVFDIIGGVFSLIFGILGGMVELVFSLLGLGLLIGIIYAAVQRRRDYKASRKPPYDDFKSFYDQDGTVE